MSLKRQLRNDPEFLALGEIVSVAQRNFHPDKVLKEAETLHAQRSSRSLLKVKMAPTPLYDASMKDLSNRARLTELKAGLVRLSRSLARAIESCRTYVSTQYGDYLAEYRTQAEKKKVLDRIFSDSQDVLDGLHRTIEVLDLYVVDLDKAGYGLRLAVDLLKLTVERRDQIV